jgi:hypothetical protein
LTFTQQKSEFSISAAQGSGTLFGREAAIARARISDRLVAAKMLSRKVERPCAEAMLWLTQCAPDGGCGAPDVVSQAHMATTAIRQAVSGNLIDGPIIFQEARLLAGHDLGMGNRD